MTVRLLGAAALAICALLLTVSACWAQDRPAMDIPIYAGGEASMEVNLSNEDILPMIKAMLPLAGASLGALKDAISPEDLAAVFKDVRRIQFLQIDVAKPGVADKDVADFYAKNLPVGSWNRVFWQANAASGSMAVYAQPQGEMIYAFRVRSIKQEDKAIKRVEVVKTEGQLDYVKLISLAGQFLSRPAAPAPPPAPAPTN